jgi:C-terminal processing protease CtpA/Prc
MVTLTQAQRGEVLDKVLGTIERKFTGPEPDVRSLREKYQPLVARATGVDELEATIAQLLKDLGTSHIGCFHESKPRAAGRIAIAATFAKAETTDGLRWIFQDVHPGGIAQQAGVRPGDILLTINGKEFRPPDAMPFSLGETYAFTIRRADGSTSTATMAVPGSAEKKRPIVVPSQVVSAKRLNGGIGLLRVSMFPGVLGIDVARDVSRAVAELACDRLIVDLRGNTGGGIGCLRLMSHLCADRRGVGYSLDRTASRNGRTKDQLPQFARIPASKWGVVPLAVKFARAGRSVAVFTEALGDQRHHGRIAMLVNEHSASAAEMVAAFGSEYGLATLVGMKTAGRVVATSAFKVGYGFRIVIPVAAYYTWQGTNLEGVGVRPAIEEPFSTQAIWNDQDNQLDRAVEWLQQRH